MKRRQPLSFLFLKVPIHLWDNASWDVIQGHVRRHGGLRIDEELVAFATEDRSGFQSIAMSKKIWRSSTPRQRGVLLTHELFHILRNKRPVTLKTKAIAREERFVKRSMPKRSLRARIIGGKEVVLVHRV